MPRSPSSLSLTHWLTWGLGCVVALLLVAAWTVRDRGRDASMAGQATPRPTPTSAAAAGATASNPRMGNDGGQTTGITANASDRRRWAAEGHWAGLPRGERETLAPLEEDWLELSREQRHKWLEIAAKFPGLHAEDQARLKERMREWALMSAPERSRARLTFQEARQLSAKERLERWEAYQGLDDAERRQLTEDTLNAQRAAVAPRRTEWGPPAPKGSASSDTATARLKPEGSVTVRAPTGATTHLLTRAPLAGTDATPSVRVLTSTEVVDRTTLLPQARTPAATPAAPPAVPASGATDAPNPVPADSDATALGDSASNASGSAAAEPKPKTP